MDNVAVALLVTCGTMDETKLRGEVVTKSPAKQIVASPDTDGDARIFVSFSEAVIWVIPLADCQSWFVCAGSRFSGCHLLILTEQQDFQIHFLAFWPDILQFFHRGRIVNADNWPSKRHLARHTKITLHAKIWFVSQYI